MDDGSVRAQLAMASARAQSRVASRVAAKMAEMPTIGKNAQNEQMENCSQGIQQQQQQHKQRQWQCCAQ